MKIKFFFQELFRIFVKTIILQNFEGLAEKLMTSSINADINTHLFIVFESSYYYSVC